MPVRLWSVTPAINWYRPPHDAGVTVSPIVIAYLRLSLRSRSHCLPSDRFSFIGFLNAKTHGRQKQLEALKARTETLIFYEAPHRIVASLSDMYAVFGHDRAVTFCRELTKTFETVHKTTLGDLVEFVKADDNQQRGEIVVVVAGEASAQDSDDMSIHDALLVRLLKRLVQKAASLPPISSVKKCLISAFT